ncbi:MAG: MFS transporter [Thermodesulfobacteriota bacterium]
MDNNQKIPPELTAACGISLVLYLGSYMRIPLVPLLAGRLGASTSEVGWIGAASMFAAAFLSFPLGLMSDRIGRRLLILSGVAVSCMTSVLLPAARAPLHIGLIYLFSGVGLACFSPAMMSHVADIVPARFLGRAYGWYTAAIYAGMALGPGIGGAIGSRGFGAAFAASALIVGSAIPLFFLRIGPRSDKSTRARSGGSPLPDLREVVRTPAVLACWTTTFFSSYAWGSLLSFFPLYARDAGISLVHTGLIFTAQAATNALFRIPAGHMLDRGGERRLFFLGGTTLFGSCIALTGAFRGEFPLYLLFAAVGASMAVTFTAVGTVLSESVAIRVRGLAMGGYNTCIYGGFMASAAVTGIVMERWGYAAGFASAGLACIVSTTVAWLPRRTR